VTARLPWRNGFPVPAPAEPVDELARLRTENQRLRNERATLTSQLRDTNRDKLKAETALAATQARLDRERRHNEATCAHARQAADVRRLAALFQDRYLEQRRINEAYTEADLKPATDSAIELAAPPLLRAAKVPKQRARRGGAE
jgi:hypothetical protein